jgi:hypothetical protein
VINLAINAHDAMSSVAFVLLLAAAPVLAQASPPPAADASSAETEVSPEAAVSESAEQPEPKPWKLWLEHEEPVHLVAEPEPTWYGWQTLGIDVLSLTVGVLTAAAGGVIFGMGALVIGSPIVHFAHANVSGGLISFGIRALAGGLFVAAVGLAHGETEQSNRLGLLAGVTIVSAIVVDAAVLGWDDEGASQPVSLAPFVDPVQGRAGMHYAVSF